MAWRIHFTDEDLARIQISPTLGPLAETVMGLVLLRSPCAPRRMFGEWRSQVEGTITSRMTALTNLIPPGSTGVDLLTLTGEAPTIGQGLAALLAMPREHVLVEMGITDRWYALPAAAWAMAEPGAREELADAARAAHRALLEPYWSRLHARLHAEQVVRSRILARGGPDRVLASLQGQHIRWRAPVLEVANPRDADLHLGGRGIAIVPSVFVGRAPQLTHDPSDPRKPPRLIMPAVDGGLRQGDLWSGPQAKGTALASLVGRNRAAVLQAVVEGCTTTELADRVGISLAAASQHASVLRDAGLVITLRQGGAVLHVLTPLGAELLHAGLPERQAGYRLTGTEAKRAGHRRPDSGQPSFGSDHRHVVPLPTMALGATCPQSLSAVAKTCSNRRSARTHKWVGIDRQRSLRSLTLPTQRVAGDDRARPARAAGPGPARALIRRRAVRSVHRRHLCHQDQPARQSTSLVTTRAGTVWALRPSWPVDERTCRMSSQRTTQWRTQPMQSSSEPASSVPLSRTSLL
ncbi:MAG TPA: winged helix-turn-helix domain-containing protein [Streptosporangiaceae bacterium]|nr:winged helix-turn-helix domain-containing protein [Streptosporangiaceae bacterium]